MKRNASLTELGFLLIKAGLLDAPVHLIGGWNFADSLALCRKRGPVAADWKMHQPPPFTFYTKSFALNRLNTLLTCRRETHGAPIKISTAVWITIKV